jgi:hypothetical protein
MSEQMMNPFYLKDLKNKKFVSNLLMMTKTKLGQISKKQLYKKEETSSFQLVRNVTYFADSNFQGFIVLKWVSTDYSHALGAVIRLKINLRAMQFSKSTKLVVIESTRWQIWFKF